MKPVFTELVPVSPHGKQTGQPHGSDRGTELQHRRPPGRSAKAMTKKNSLYESVFELLPVKRTMK